MTTTMNMHGQRAGAKGEATLMGFTPGDFTCRKHGKVHFELKDGPRIVIWNADESLHLIDLDAENFRAAFEQMQTLAALAGID